MKMFAFAAFTIALSAPAWAQSPTPATTSEAPFMTSEPTTMAPVAPGSTKMHEVPTPTATQRTTTSVGQKLTGKGGN